MRNLNFLTHASGRLRFLQVGALSALMVSGVIGGVLIGGGGGRTATITDTETATPTPIAARVQVGAPKTISENAVNSVAVSTKNESAVYYEAQTGKSFSVNLNTGTTDILSSSRLTGFISAQWLVGNEQVVAEFQQPSGVQYRFFDYKTGTTKTIGADILALTPSPNGKQVAYLKSSDTGSALFIGDSDGSSSRKLLDTRAENVQLAWPSTDRISFSSQRSDRVGRDLITLDLSGAITSVMADRENLEYNWSPNGLYLLFSYFIPESGITLWLRDISSGTDLSLGLATSAQKCAWHHASTTITCGVPSQNGLSRDVPANRSATIDDIVTVDLLSGQRTTQYQGNSTKLMSVIDPLLSASEEHFVFTNLFDRRLMSLDI